MSIVEDTKQALLELFPEQAQAEAEAEAEAAEAAQAAAEEAEVAEASGEEAEATEVAPEEAAAEGAGEGEEEQAAAAEEEPEPEPEPITSGIIVTDYNACGVHLDVLASPDQVVDAARILNDAGFYLESIAGVDWIKEEEMEVIYDYNRTDGLLCRVCVRARIPRAEPEIPTISEIHPSADWHERETHEFFGIKFIGHPYLVPLLLPEDADFHPLLKDFKP